MENQEQVMLSIPDHVNHLWGTTGGSFRGPREVPFVFFFFCCCVFKPFFFIDHESESSHAEGLSQARRSSSDLEDWL